MSTRISLSLGLCLLLVASTSLLVAAQPEDLTIQEFTYTGDEDVPTARERLHLWQSTPHQFDVVIETRSTVRSVEVCLVTRAATTDGEHELTCQSVSLAASSVETVSVTVDQWPANLTGNQTLRAVVRESSDQVLTEESLSITVIRKSGDRDTDGLSNQREVALGTSITKADTDADGLADRLEIHTYETDPLSQDSDSDGLSDGVEVQQHRTDPKTIDTDGDGLSDGFEVTTVGTNPNKRDTDIDGLSDAAEVNTYNTNASAADTDGDGLGDGTEVNDQDTNPTNPDTDDDGLTDGREVTIFGTDPTRGDTDGDGLSDAAEVMTHQTDPTNKDTDGDGLNDGAEIRTHQTNPNTQDTDSDGLDDQMELKRGTDPTVPTTTPQKTVFGRIVGLLMSRYGSIVLGGSVVVIAAVTVAYYRSDASIPRLNQWISRTGINTRATSGDTESGTADSSVLTNEEQIRQLLDENDGRMLQSDIVDAADWSKATVSRVLSEMESDGAVTRVDIGKGNLVARPGDEPENARSSFSE